MLYSMSKLNIYITPQIKIVVVAKLQEEPQSPLPPGYSFLCRPFPIWPVKPIDYGESDGISFPRLGCINAVAPIMGAFSWDYSGRRSQLPCHEGTQVTYDVSSQQPVRNWGLPTTLWAWEHILPQLDLQIISLTTNYKVMRSWARTTQLSRSLICLIN